MKNCLYQNKRQIYKTQKRVKYKYIRLYVLQYFVIKQLSPNRKQYLLEKLKTKKKNVRMNLEFINTLDIYPIDLDQHIKDMSNTLEIVKNIEETNHNVTNYQRVSRIRQT